MAGALDIKRETLRIRREQQERNRKAVMEAEKRRAEMKENIGRPSDKHRRKFRETPPLQREGHRMVHTSPTLDDVQFGSPVARQLAEEAHLTADIFEEYEASGATGFTKKDVENIIEDLEEEDELEDEEFEDDDDWDDEDDEEKMEEDYEDKMDRGGENK